MLRLAPFLFRSVARLPDGFNRTTKAITVSLLRRKASRIAFRNQVISRRLEAYLYSLDSNGPFVSTAKNITTILPLESSHRPIIPSSTFLRRCDLFETSRFSNQALEAMSDHELEAMLSQAGYASLLNSPKSPSEYATSKRRREEPPATKPEAKAKREKARREKINQRFAALAALSNPEDPKGDKASVLLDALTTLKALKVENDQLKQLNKHLEEKVSNYEKERSFVLYQQSLLLQANPPPFFSGMMQPYASQVAPDNTVTGTPVLNDDQKESLPSESFLHPPAA